MDLTKIIPNVIELFPDLLLSLEQTLIMVSISFVIAGLIGLPLGVILMATKEEELFKSPTVNRILSSIIDLLRSMPTLILITAITPFTKMVMGTRIGIKGAIVPLVVASAPFLARQIEAALSKVDRGVIEAAKSMGTSNLGVIMRVILPESLSGIINAYTIMFVSLINFSAVAGAVGGGGLGDFALRYGYQQFKTDIMVVTVAVLLVLVVIVQTAGKNLSRRVLK